MFVVEAAPLVLFITGCSGAFQPLVAEFSSATSSGLGSRPKEGLSFSTKKLNLKNAMAKRKQQHDFTDCMAKNKYNK